MTGYYVTAIDRIGWAFATGGAIGGLYAVLLAARAGSGVAGIAAASAIGTAITLLLLVLVAAPIWTWFHQRGFRGPGTAAALGAGLAVVMAAVSGALPVTPLAGLGGAAIGWAMQRAGYRRLF